MRTHAELNLLLVSETFFQDPYPAYAVLRETDPVHWCEPWGAWVVTSFDAVLEVLRRPDAFSSSGSELAMLESVQSVPGGTPELVAHYSANVLSITDPPVHTRLRRLLVTSFTPRVVEQLRPRVEELITELLDPLDVVGEIDVLGRFGYPLPALVIGELLGVPREDQHLFMRWSAAIVSFVGTGAADAERAVVAESSMREFRDYLRPLIARRRAEEVDDLLGSLAGPAKDGDRLDDEELIAACVTLLFAGHETTANLIGNGLVALLRHPDQLALLREDPGLAVAATEELLRYDGSVQRSRRRAVSDVLLGVRRIAADDRVLAFLGAANRDPAVFEQPDQLDIRRNAGRHLAFGHGIHYCVGAALSRLEVPLALNALLARYPRLRLVEDAVRWKPNIAFRGLEEVRVVVN